MRIRTYGSSGPFVVLLHGGPGAPGSMAPVARALEDRFRLLEPFQRGSAEEPLTVARHVEDLHEPVVSSCPEAKPALVGSSWGAMLALAYAAEHPDAAAALVLIGCGTFDLRARARMRAILKERTDDHLRQRLERLEEEIPDPHARLGAMADLIEPLYTYDPLPERDESEPIDARAHEETWHDMVRLQEEGIYPAAFSAIRSPVLMLHGSYDPHPGRMIRAGLAALMPQLEYREWEQCGHYPWREKAVRGEFFTVLGNWLRTQYPPSPG
jgi:pimeloyl-ACP methyl ester carboxylesterase